MTTNQQQLPPLCENVQMAAMALLDGEPASLTADEVHLHIGGCPSCASAISALTAVHADLTGLEQEYPDVDLWPALQRNIRSTATDRTPQEGRTILLLLVALVVTWRLTQLLLDLPGPVVNSLAPLAVVVFLLRRLTGDPFAIQPSMNQFHQ
jgi:hypothetical protein